MSQPALAELRARCEWVASTWQRQLMDELDRSGGRYALITNLDGEPTDREDAIRAAAEWARENLGLHFARLRRDGQIVQGLRSAINSAIRRGEVVHHDARRISRGTASTYHPARRESVRIVNLSVVDGDFTIHEMGTFYCVDGRIIGSS